VRGAGLAPAPPRDRSQQAAQLLRSGVAAQQEGDHMRALDIFLRAIDARPDDWIAHTCLGNSLRSLGRLDESIAIHRRALELGGDHRARANLSLTYREAGRLDEAIAILREAIAISPDSADLHGNLAGLWLAAQQPAQAEVAARRALALSPGDARFASNLGYARKEQGDFAGAAQHLRQAIARDPQDADAHWNLGLTLLAAPTSAEDEAEGWRQLEWRQRIPGLGPAPRPETTAIPTWNGEPLQGRTLLLQAEQGLGDTLQFARYARLVKERAGAGAIVLECQPPLERLLRRCAGVDVVVPRGGALPAISIDARAGLFGLPMRLGGRAPGAGTPTPYLSAEPERIAHWRAVVAARTGAARFRIGIAWQGNPRYRADARRSIPLVQFLPLVRAVVAAGGAVVSLQKGQERDARDALAALPSAADVVDLGPALDADGSGGQPGGAFVDTAAVMAGLDLVITSDTAIPHLAGALGVPVWLALAHLPDWRWGLAGESCGWYPETRLYRQTSAGDWTGVFARMVGAVRDRWGGMSRGAEDATP
jgi:Flp pilus assembly protein TadD